MAYEQQDDPGDEDEDTGQWPDAPVASATNSKRQDDAIKGAHDTWDAIMASLAGEARRQEARYAAKLESALGMHL